jgi:hypothetical protein
MKIYCLVCNEEFEADVATYCPCCGAVGDDLEPYDEDPAPTDEEIEAMFADYNERYGISRPLALMGAI